MKRRIFLGTCLSLAAVGSLVKAAEKPRAVQNISLVLDCSASMGGSFPLPVGEDAEPVGLSSTKLAESRTALLELLNDLSTTGAHKVSLWLYGHRLQWEAGAEEPKLLEQTTFFEHTQGFEVLTTLLPGDDVQAIRAPQALEPKHLAAISATLETLEPWGEDPLYLALRQVVEMQPRQGAPSDRRVVVLTDGGHSQGMARFRTSKDQVLESLRKHEVPIHIVYLGNAKVLPRQTASDFMQLARASQGKVHTVQTLEQLHDALQAAVLPPSAVDRSAPARLETVSAATATFLKPVTVQGKVTFYKKAVKGADIVLTGENVERKLKTDADGLFKLEGVPGGSYTLTTSIVIKNKVRDNSRTVTIPLTAEQPIELAIELE